MDIGAAQFSRVELFTELSFPFAKEITAIARAYVQRYKEMGGSPSMLNTDSCFEMNSLFNTTTGLPRGTGEERRDDFGDATLRMVSSKDPLPSTLQFLGLFLL